MPAVFGKIIVAEKDLIGVFLLRFFAMFFLQSLIGGVAGLGAEHACRSHEPDEGQEGHYPKGIAARSDHATKPNRRMLRQDFAFNRRRIFGGG